MPDQPATDTLTTDPKMAPTRRHTPRPTARERGAQPPCLRLPHQGELKGCTDSLGRRGTRTQRPPGVAFAHLILALSLTTDEDGETDQKD